jgi:hypothetical protein
MTMMEQQQQQQQQQPPQQRRRIGGGSSSSGSSRLGAVCAAGLLLLASAGQAAASRVAKSTGKPSFFLQDPADGSCLAGGEFKRCAIDTLWYVQGKPGHYQIHRRPVEETDEELCLDK